jgi:3-oxoacyl-[acyl-carrier protein] reductase
MMMQGDNVTIITGASRGIGEAIALRLAEEKHNLMLFGRDEEKLKNVTGHVVERTGVNAEYFVGDVSDPKFVEDSVQDIVQNYGRVDNLINNAGTAVFKNVVDTTLEDFQKHVDTNLYGVYNFTRAVLSGMIERKSGSIINIASLAGKNPVPGGAMYSATKHALLGFTKSLFAEVRQYNLRVAAICPGSVQTDFIMKNSSKPPKPEKILRPADVAELVATALKLPQHALVSEMDLRPTNPK